MTTEELLVELPRDRYRVARVTPTTALPSAQILGGAIRGESPALVKQTKHTIEVDACFLHIFASALNALLLSRLPLQLTQMPEHLRRGWPRRHKAFPQRAINHWPAIVVVFVESYLPRCIEFQRPLPHRFKVRHGFSLCWLVAALAAGFS